MNTKPGSSQLSIWHSEKFSCKTLQNYCGCLNCAICWITAIKHFSLLSSVTVNLIQLPSVLIARFFALILRISTKVLFFSEWKNLVIETLFIWATQEFCHIRVMHFNIQYHSLESHKSFFFEAENSWKCKIRKNLHLRENPPTINWRTVIEPLLQFLVADTWRRILNEEKK